MNDKKHIDRLFQEKFKDFEMKPSANVWANIEKQLEEPKRKRRVIPIWLRYGGVAATLLLFLVIGNSILNNNNAEGNTIVDTKTEDTVRSNTSNNENENAVIKEKENIEGAAKNNTTISDTNNTDSKSIESNQIKSKNESKALQNKSEKINNLNYSTSNSVIAERNSNLNRSNSTKNDTYNINSENTPSEKTAKNTTLYAENTKVSNSENNIKNKSINSTAVTSNTTKNDKINNKSQKGLDNNIVISNTDIASTNSEKEEKKKENMIEEDSANSSESIEEAIAKNQDLNEKENVVDKWTVNANVAPVYYNTLGKGSHIHDQFINNPKDGEVNTSYGIKVGYALNKKLKVRSGVNKLDLSYDTANVIVFNDVSTTANASTALRNIDFVPDSRGQTFAILSRNNLNVLQVSNLVGDNLNVALSQRISYIEVPLELEYALVENKLGVNVIGGASAFILSENEIVSEIDNRKTKIGEANNINNVSYSANIGLGIDYKFSKKLKFNLEPTFKYQMNAYNETSGDFRPYIIGVYTGFSYKF